MSIFQLTKKLLTTLQKYVYYPNTFFDINHMENMSILRENIDKCVILKHRIHSKNIHYATDKIVEVRVELACDIVFDFELTGETLPIRTELLCDDVVIHKNIYQIQYENAFPVVASGCNYIKLRLYYEHSLESDYQCVAHCKYGLLPPELRNTLKKVDIHDMCKKDEWIVC